VASREESLDDVRIVALDQLEQYRETLAVQETVWGFSDLDKVPPRLFTVARLIGGVVLGAYLGDRMIGYSLGLPGRDAADGETYLHSHMTGILAEFQGRGLGRRLKMRQKEEALRLGYGLIEWTFDPLEIRNAYFNVEKLGVRVRRYEPNVYGVTSSKLHAGAPTDRLVAEWRIDGEPEAAAPTEEILVPADVRASPERTLAVQAEVRERFKELFARRHVVVGYRVSQDGGRYLLAPPAPGVS